MRNISFAIPFVLGGLFGGASAVAGAEKPDAPRIDCVIPLIEQPHAVSPDTIWYDDFDGEQKSYAEGSSPLDDNASVDLSRYVRPGFSSE